MMSRINPYLAKIKQQLGIDKINPGTLEAYVKEDNGLERKIHQELMGVNPVVLKRYGLLDWAYCHARFCDESDRLKVDIIRYHGKNYFQNLDSARLVVWRVDGKINFPKILTIKALLEKYSGLNLKADELTDCRTVEEMMKKLTLYERLSRGKLNQFYKKGVEWFKLGNYRVLVFPGSWECFGGLDLSIFDQTCLVSVGGRLHRKTEVTTIQGQKGKKAKMDHFKEEMGIHPANLCLLMYLQLGQLLGHTEVSIRGFASKAFNYRNIDSNLYDIPRNYFRLRINKETSKYEFCAETREKILDKFYRRDEVIRNVFEKMKEMFG